MIPSPNDLLDLIVIQAKIAGVPNPNPGHLYIGPSFFLATKLIRILCETGQFTFKHIELVLNPHQAAWLTVHGLDYAYPPREFRNSLRVHMHELEANRPAIFEVTR
jgi:hypothetical protein